MYVMYEWMRRRRVRCVLRLCFKEPRQGQHTRQSLYHILMIYGADEQVVKGVTGTYATMQ